MANTTKKLSTVDETASSDISSANMLCVSNGHVKQLPNYIQQIDKNKSDIAAMMLKIYPVGAIYISASDTNPGTLFGGTWEQIKGRFLVAVGALEENNDTYFGTVKAGDINCPAGAKGGEVWHTLTANEMPSHNHSASTGSAGEHTHSASTNWTGDHTHRFAGGGGFVGGGQWGSAGANIRVDSSGYIINDNTTSAGGHSHSVTVNANGAHSHTISVSATGGSAAHNNMPPYLAVYMWKRTA